MDCTASDVDTSESLPQRLRAVRISCDLTQQELARRAGLSRSHVCELEKGAAHPSVACLRKIAKVVQVTLDDLLDGVPYRPRHGGRRALTNLGAALHGHFPTPRSVQPPQSLHAAFRLARFTVQGNSLLAQLSQQRRSRDAWRVIKQLASYLNGPEQELVLHLLVNGGAPEEIHPGKLGFLKPIVDDRGGRFHGIVLAVEGGLIVVYPQLGVITGKGRHCTIDFLVCVGVDRRVVFISGEVDSKWHKGKEERDAGRDRAVGLPSMRIPDHEVDRPDFFKRFVRSVRARLDTVVRSAPASNEAGAA